MEAGAGTYVVETYEAMLQISALQGIKNLSGNTVLLGRADPI